MNVVSINASAFTQGRMLINCPKNMLCSFSALTCVARKVLRRIFTSFSNRLLYDSHVVQVSLVCLSSDDIDCEAFLRRCPF